MSDDETRWKICRDTAAIAAGDADPHKVIDLYAGKTVYRGTKPECFRYVGEALGRAVPESRREA